MIRLPSPLIHRRAWAWLASWVWLTAVQAAEPSATSATPALTARNLLVGLRQIELVPQDSVTVSTRPQKPPLMTGQQVLVGNGQTARFAISQGQFLQWASVGPSGLAPVGVQTDKVWLVTGQNLSVQPRWRSGETSVELGLVLQASTPQPGRSTDLPRVSGQDLQTQVTLPLNQWTTIAVTGDDPTRGGQVTVSTGRWPRAMQIRVTMP